MRGREHSQCRAGVDTQGSAGRACQARANPRAHKLSAMRPCAQDIEVAQSKAQHTLTCSVTATSKRSLWSVGARCSALVSVALASGSWSASYCALQREEGHRRALSRQHGSSPCGVEASYARMGDAPAAAAVKGEARKEGGEKCQKNCRAAVLAGSAQHSLQAARQPTAPGRA